MEQGAEAELPEAAALLRRERGPVAQRGVAQGRRRLELRLGHLRVLEDGGTRAGRGAIA